MSARASWTRRMSSGFVLALAMGASLPVHAAVSSFSIGSFPGIKDWNALGISAAPGSGDIFVNSLSYSGEDNLYRFSGDGSLLFSTRVDYLPGPVDGYSVTAMSALDADNLYVNVLTSGPSGPVTSLVHLDGSGRVLSSAPMDRYLHGLEYNPASSELLFMDYRDPAFPLVVRTALDGHISGSDGLRDPFVGEDPGRVGDAAYDPTTGAFYISYRFNLLGEYTLAPDGTYRSFRAYDLGQIGVTNILALDVDRSNGAFYVQDNNQRIVRFVLSELTVTPVPEPSTMALLFAGLGVLYPLVVRRQRPHMRAAAS
jgi:hypothetical protein